MNYFLIAALVPLFTLLSYTNEALSYYSRIPEFLEDTYGLAGIVVALPGFLFGCLFVFRYLRLIVHLISFWFLYKPVPIPDNPTLLPKDVSVILPTVDPQNTDFQECILSCLSNSPGEIIIVTVGRNMAALTNQIVSPYRAAFPNTHIQIHFTNIASKRLQVAHGVGFAKGKVTVLLDDHVFWRTNHFLATVLAPFENDKVGAVGTNKRVRRTDPGFNIRSFWNMIGALYLERHNFEIRATNAIDGGVFVISGRTAAYRTDILKAPGFMQGFTNERFFFRMFGPLNADDDNYLTRQVVARGYNIKIQYSDDALIETTLGTYPKFLSQCLRWVRTTWRSNSASLFTDGTVWYRQPWCVYAVFLTSFVNFALFYDAALIYTLSRIAGPTAVKALIAWIFCTKMVKLTPYFLREPQDLLMLPGYFLFAYYHSLIKLYAGLTFWVTAWGGRNLDAINQGNDDDDGPPDGGNNDGFDGGNGGDDAHSHSSSGSSTEVPDSSSSGNTARPPPPRRSLPSGSQPVQTPWGAVRGGSPPTIPANVLESQLVTPPRRGRRVSAPVSQQTNNFSTPTQSGRAQSFPRNPMASGALGSTPSPNSPWQPALQNPFAPALGSNLAPLLTPAATPASMIVSTPAVAPAMMFPLTPTATPAVLNSTPAVAMTVAPLSVNTPYRVLPRERHGLGIPDVCQKSWTRGKQCRCLHSDGDFLFKTRPCRCEVPNTFNLGRSVVPNRPRF